MVQWSSAATALPGVDTFRVLAAADPARLSAAELVDAVIVSERLLADVNGVQVRLLAELGRPNRCTEVTDLVSALVDKAGVGRGPGGEVDAAEVAEVTADRSIGVAAAEVAAVLDWSPVTARIRIGQAMRMVDALPATLVALAAGRVDVGRARMIVDRTAVLAAELCGPIERRILPLVRGRSKGQLESLMDREVVAADPVAAENRRLAAVKGRSVSHRVDKDGMGVINALLPAEAAVLVFTLVDLIAAANKGLDGRTVDQRRADAIADIADELLTYGFVDLDGLVARAEHAAAPAPAPAAATGTAGTATAADGASGGASADGTPPPDKPHADADPGRRDADVDRSADGDVRGCADADAGTGRSADTAGGDADPDADAGVVVSAVGGADVDRAGRLARAMTRHGRRPHLVVTGAWTTLAGLDDLPGHLDGHGTITAELLRAIAKSWGTVTAVGVDPGRGTATGVGAMTYRPGRRVSDEVIAVSGTCRAAGCRMPAGKCDLDHVEPFNHANPAAGGLTTTVNQLPLCRFHHLLKHHTEWTPHLQSDMTVVWTTATGHTATSYPRQFTLPGEWDRRVTGGCRTGGTSSGGVADDVETTVADVETTVGGAVPGPAGGSTTIAGARVLVGPVVAGPTIPVVQAGADYQEPHTELEDPGTVPHPGSVEINTYRALREDTRRHALRRLRRLAQTVHPVDDTSAARAERGDFDRRWRASQSDPSTADDPATHGGAELLDFVAAQHPLPDEPPF